MAREELNRSLTYVVHKAVMYDVINQTDCSYMDSIRVPVGLGRI